MPRYEYVCPSGHVTERQADYDQEEIECLELRQPPHRGRLVLLRLCRKLAQRRPAYRSQGVVFSGTGFTRTVIPPPPPKPTTTPGEPAEDWLEKTDEYVKEQHRDDEEYRPERKKQLTRMLRETERGAIP